MKKLLILILFLPFLASAQLAGRVNFSNFAWEVYGVFTDSTLTELRDSLGPNVYLDSYYSVHTGRFRVVRLDQTHNDGRPINVTFTDDSGYVKRAPMDSLVIKQFQVTGLIDSLANRYVKSQIDAFLTGKLNISDTSNMLTVYARKIEYYTKTNLQTSGQAQVHWDNLTNKPTVGTVSSVGITSTGGTITVTGSPITTSGNINVDLPNSGITAGKYLAATYNAKGIATSGTNPTLDTISASRSFNFAYQMSASSWVQVYVSAAVSCSLSLSGGQSGEIFLEVSADGSTNWIMIGKVTGSNTGTLTVGLATTGLTGSQLSILLPPAYYWRLRTNNITGSPTYTMNGGAKMTY